MGMYPQILSNAPVSYHHAIVSADTSNLQEKLNLSRTDSKVTDAHSIIPQGTLNQCPMPISADNNSGIDPKYGTVKIDPDQFLSDRHQSIPPLIDL